MNTKLQTPAVKTPAAGLVDYFGPARVMQLMTPCVEVRCPDGTVRLANMALAFPYQPAVGDVLLVAARGQDTYVIGVIKGSGTTDLAFQGDVTVRSVGGKVSISGDEGVAIQGPRVDVVAERMKLVVDAFSESLTTCITRVRELLTVHAGESRAVVKGAWYAQSETAQIHTKKTIGINGREVHLG